MPAKCKPGTIRDGLTLTNISELNGATIFGARFASGADLKEICDTRMWSPHQPIILFRVRTLRGELLELMPLADPEGNGPGFLEITPLVEVEKKEKK